MYTGNWCLTLYRKSASMLSLRKIINLTQFESRNLVLQSNLLNSSFIFQVKKRPIILGVEFTILNSSFFDHAELIENCELRGDELNGPDCNFIAT